MPKKTKINIVRKSILSDLTNKTNISTNRNNKKIIFNTECDEDTEDIAQIPDIKQINSTNHQINLNGQINQDTPKTDTEQIKPQRTREELLYENILKIIENNKNEEKPRKDIIDKSELLVIPANNIKNKEIVVTGITVNNIEYFVDEYNNIVDLDQKIIGIYYNGKVYLIDYD